MLLRLRHRPSIGLIRPLVYSRRHSHIATAAKDWNVDEDFFHFSRGRFICDEDHNMSMRTVRFDMNRLAQVAAESINANYCIHVEKCPDGMYNQTFRLTMNDGRQVIGKVPNPNAGRAHFTTASEVATMDYIRNVLDTPAPQVYAWSSTTDNNVGSEYIIMEKMPGAPLSQVWEQMKLTDKLRVISQLFQYQQKWLSAPFEQIGSLYYTVDTQADVSDPYPRGSDGVTAENERFAIGPATGREWVDEGRSSLPCDRGPWVSIMDYHQAILQREGNAIKSTPHLPKQMAMLCGPTLYQPTQAKKLAALDSSARIIKYLIPAKPSICTSHLWHNDLHEENIFVNSEDPTKITGIIDWQSTQIASLFENTIDPGILDYDGPGIESLDHPTLPDNFSQLSKADKAVQIQLLNRKALLIAYRRLLQKSPPLKAASEFQASTAFSILKLSKRVFEIGEAHLLAITSQLGNEWSDLIAVREAGKPPFPLSFTEDQLQQIKRDADAADIGIQMMDNIRQQIGNLWPDKGVVRAENYDETKQALKKVKADVVRKLGLSGQEKKDFMKYWPFDD